MGYRTDFVGAFRLSIPLERAQHEYLTKFNQTRRMKRDPDKAAKLPDPVREAAGLPVGPEGAYFVGGTGHMGQDHDCSILDYNNEPVGQPGLWCQWAPDGTGEYIGWDGGEKFYSYVEWLEYLIEHFLKPWKLELSGVVRWRGEDAGDRGSIVVNGHTVGVRGGEKIRITHGAKFKNRTCIGVSNKPARA